MVNPVIFVIFLANASVGPTALNTSMLATAGIANVAAAATIAIASRNTFVFMKYPYQFILCHIALCRCNNKVPRAKSH